MGANDARSATATAVGAGGLQIAWHFVEPVRMPETPRHPRTVAGLDVNPGEDGFVVYVAAS
jgi:hypothetical protein